MRSTACSYTVLPVAPATVSSASTSGTPAEKVTARVREKRAMAPLCITCPITGNLRIIRSSKCASAGERFRAKMKAAMPPPMIRASMHHPIRDAEDQVGEGRQVGTVVLECFTELRHYEHEEDAANQDGNGDNRRRIEQGLFDL